MKTFQRERLMRTIGFHEMFTFIVISVLLVGLISVPAALFLVVFLVLWLGVFLFVLSGRLIPTI